MFLLSFAVSIAIYTIWLNAKLGILISLVMIGLVLIGLLLHSGVLRIRRRGNPKSGMQSLDCFGRIRNSSLAMTGKQCLRMIVGNLLALLVICGNLRRKGGNYLQQFWEFGSSIDGLSAIHPDATGWQTFNGFGTIIDTQKYHTYLFENAAGEIWRLSSNQTYHIGDQIFLSASVKLLDTSVIFDSTFIPPWKAEFRDYQFNYDKRIFMKGIDGTAYEKQALLVDPAHPGTMFGQLPPEKKLGLIDRTRADLQRYVERVYGQNQYAGLLLGLLIGDKSLIPTDQYNTFVDSGLVHIIAVSGGNIAMVVILLSFLLKRVPLYVRNGLIIVMIIVYAMICGGDSSVVRAAIMGCLTLLALFWGREVSIWRAMKYAFVGILLFNPFSLVYDVGLLLSFSAIIGIVLFQKLCSVIARTTDETIQKKKKADIPHSWIASLRLWLRSQGLTFRKEYLTPTIGASLGTAPVLMFFMNGVNLLGIVLNVVIVPLIPVITIYGFASLLLYAIIAWNGWVWVEVLLMKLVYVLSQFGAEYAIFVQARNVVAKYVLVVLFVGLGIWGYRKVMRKKE